MIDFSECCCVTPFYRWKLEKTEILTECNLNLN